MSLPKEPRQKMINLMYLVLTALLALNVSSEILHAFEIVKKSLDTSTEVASGKTDQLFKSFQRKMDDPSSKEMATIWNDKAKKVHELSDAMYKYVDQMQLELKKEAGYNPPKDTAFKIDDLEAATRLFITGNEAKKTTPKGKEMYNKLVEFKANLLTVDSSFASEFATTLPLDLPKVYGEGAKDWGNTYFHMTPTIAGLTILSKFQNDIRNSEAQIVEYCHKKIGEVIFTYDAFKVIANSSASYMMPGDEFTINAGIGAFSSKAEPQVSVDGQGASKTPEGDYEVKMKAPESPGDYTKTVTINYRDQKTGKMESTTKQIKFTVGKPAGLTIATDRTRVFYAGGLENELSVTGSGGSELIDVDISGTPGIEKIPKGNGSFIIKCSQPGTAVVKVTDRKANKTQTINIPIKKVPDPYFTVGGKKGGDMAANVFRAQSGVAAKLENFLFDNYSFKVVSFNMYFTGTGFEDKSEIAEVQGNMFNAEAKKFMGRCQAGTIVIIGGVRVADLIGNQRDLDGNITFVLE